MLNQANQNRTLTSQRQTLGLIAYVRRYFRATRWPAMLWCFFSLVVLLLASPLKPILGLSGLVIGCAISAAISLSAFSWFVLGRVREHLFRKQKSLPQQPRCRLARLAYGGFFLTVGLLVLSIIESFSAAEGIVASKVAPIGKLQAQILESVYGDKAADRLAGIDRTADGSTDQSAFEPEGKVAGDETALSVAPQPITSWADDQVEQSAVETRFGSLANSSGIASPGGSFSAQLTPFDVPVVLGSADASSMSGESLVPTVLIQKQASEIEAALGFAGRATAELFSRDTTPERGGAFSEALRVPTDAILFGGDHLPPDPGGVFKSTLSSIK
jgi:hypothetical protein